MQTTEVDGVPVFWAETPGPLSAGLLFGCGTRDETFLTIGVTHLIKRLVMSTVPKLDHHTNASVDLTTTGFSATGRPEQVVAFLATVCAAIAALPVHRLAAEAGVLEAEGRRVTHPTASALLTRRYGIRNVGLEKFTGPGPTSIGVDAVLAHLRHFFVAGNAALWLSGPPPAELRLPLPAGVRPVRAEPTPLPQNGPCWSEERVPGPGLLVRGEAEAALDVAWSVLIGRLTDEARRGQGRSYEVFAETLHIGPTTREHLIGAVAPKGQQAAVVEILWRAATELATAGPTEQELRHAKDGAARRFADERQPARDACRAAACSLFGVEQPPAQERLAQLLAVTRDDVRESLGRALPTALIAVPADVRPDLPGVSEGGCPRRRAQPVGEPFLVKPLVRLLSWQWRAPRYYLSGTGLARLDPDGDLHETTFADIVAVHADDDLPVVFAANGCLFPIPVDAYRDGERLLHAVETAVPPGLRFGLGGRPPAAMVSPGGGIAARLWRVLNAAGAAICALATVFLALDWWLDDGSVWWPVGTAALALLYAWDAGFRRRRRAPAVPPTTGSGPA